MEETGAGGRSVGVGGGVGCPYLSRRMLSTIPIAQGQGECSEERMRVWNFINVWSVWNFLNVWSVWIFWNVLASRVSGDYVVSGFSGVT